jgi:hypothetical protein
MASSRARGPTAMKAESLPATSWLEPCCASIDDGGLGVHSHDKARGVKGRDRLRGYMLFVILIAAWLIGQVPLVLAGPATTRQRRQQRHHRVSVTPR